MDSFWSTIAIALPFSVLILSCQVWITALVGKLLQWLPLLPTGASMQKVALVNAVALPAEHVKGMPPTATRVKETSSWTRGCAGKPAPRGTWPWKGCASTAQRCVRTASMRKHAKVPGSLTGEGVGTHYLRVGCPSRTGGASLPTFTEIDLHGCHWGNWGWHKAFPWWSLQIKTDKRPFFARFLPHMYWAVRVW